jgi:hypothetical protein
MYDDDERRIVWEQAEIPVSRTGVANATTGNEDGRGNITESGVEAGLPICSRVADYSRHYDCLFRGTCS